MDPERSRGIVLRQASLSRVFGGPAVPPWPFVFRCSRPPHTTGRMGQWHAKSVGSTLNVSSQPHGARRAPIRSDIAIQRRAEEVRGGFNRSAIWRDPPNHWRAITRLGCGCSANASAPPITPTRKPASLGRTKTMNREDLLFWLSLAWCFSTTWALSVLYT